MLNRREAIALSTLPLLSAFSKADDKPKKPTFGYSLNTSTIRGQKLPVEEEAKLAAKAGYNGFEPWIRELDDYEKRGKDLKDLGKQLADSGLKVESAIGFAKWIVDDDAERGKGLDEAKRDMEKILKIGGKRMAAPPIGATDKTGISLITIAERFRKLAELGAQMGVTPECEVWGHSKTLHLLGEISFVAMECQNAKVTLLPDVFHLYKGGSDFDGLKLLKGSAIGIFHINDYPKDLPRATIKDADRVFPGDGCAPLTAILKTLVDIGYEGMLSLELFNPEYYKRDAFQVLATGLEKMKEQVGKL